MRSRPSRSKNCEGSSPGLPDCIRCPYGTSTKTWTSGGTTSGIGSGDPGSVVGDRTGGRRSARRRPSPEPDPFPLNPCAVRGGRPPRDGTSEGGDERELLAKQLRYLSGAEEVDPEPPLRS